MISLEQMLKVPQLYQEVAHAARTRAAGTASAAEEADSIRRLSEWQGASGEAADDANRRTVSTFEHSAVSDQEFAARAESASQSATKNAQGRPGGYQDGQRPVHQCAHPAARHSGDA